MIEFDWSKFDYLGHKFVPKYINERNERNRRSSWNICLNCSVQVYIDLQYFKEQIMYWDDDLFHDNTNFSPNSINIGVVPFDLTCDEVLIKKLLE